MKSYMESASVMPLDWTKSSYSGNNNNCVEAAALPTGGRAVRDSKNPNGPALLFAPGEFHAFLGAVANGEFPTA